MILHGIGFLIGLGLLYYGADFLVRGGVKIAKKCGVSSLVIGLTLVAFATSAPELVVSLGASLQGQGDLSVGNVVGSNICNIALILGLSSLITPLEVKTQLLRFDGPVMLVSALVLSVGGFFFGGFGRLFGLILFLGLLAYTWYCIRISNREMAVNQEIVQETEQEIAPIGGVRSWMGSIFWVVIGLGFLVVGGRLLVTGAVSVGRYLGISEAVIALTVVAVGTSLPELATSIVAAVKKQQDIAIGNIVGSNIFNVLGIMGVSAMARPIQCAGISPLDWATMILFSIILLPFMRSGWKLNRWEGFCLLALYCVYTTILVAMQ